MEGAPMFLESPYGADNDGAVGLQPALTTFDVNELREAALSSETVLGDDIIGQLQGHQIGQHRVVTMSNVGEGEAMADHRMPFQGLDQIRLQGIYKECRHGAGHFQILAGYGFAVIGIGDNGSADPLPQILKPCGQSVNGRSLGRNGDVEVGHPRIAVGPSAEPDDHLSQSTGVEVLTVGPCDVKRIYVQLVLVEDTGVYGGSTEVMS